MAATFLVEDGTGLAGANAYVSIANADQYHEDYDAPAAWTVSTPTDAIKQNAIRVATRYLDQVYVSRWRGYRLTLAQPLDWPRADVRDISGWLRASDALPQELVDACSILALKVVNGDTLLGDVTSTNQNIKRTRVKVDVIEDETEFFGTQSNFKKYSQVDATLRTLIQVAGQRVRA